MAWCQGEGSTLSLSITKFGHACVRIDNGREALVIDPGVMSPQHGILAGVDHVLITHEHFDHVDWDRLAAAMAANPLLTVYTCPGVARHLTPVADRVRVVRNGETFTVAGFDVSVVGEKHHVSHPDLPPVDNVGFLVDGDVLHPGDALPVLDVGTLLVPGQAPWMTMSDLIRYLRAVKPRRALAIHDGLLSDWGLRVLDETLAHEAEVLGVEVRRLAVGESVEAGLR